MTAMGRSRRRIHPFGVTSRMPELNSSATWSAVNLNPCPSVIRSADIGYFGRRGSMPTTRKDSRPVLNWRPKSVADSPKASANASNLSRSGSRAVPSGSGIDTRNARSNPHRRSTPAISLASATKPWRAATSWQAFSISCDTCWQSGGVKFLGGLAVGTIVISRRWGRAGLARNRIAYSDRHQTGYGA